MWTWEHSSLLSIFPILIVRAAGSTVTRLTRTSLCFQLFCPWKGLIQGNRLASVQDSWLSRCDVAYKWWVLTCQSGSGVCATEKWKVIKAPRQFYVSDHFPSRNRDDLLQDPIEEVLTVSSKVNHSTLKEGNAGVSTIALKVFLLSQYLWGFLHFMCLVESNGVRTLHEVSFNLLQRWPIGQESQSFREMLRSSPCQGEHVGLSTGAVTWARLLGKAMWVSVRQLSTSQWRESNEAFH